MRLPKQVSPNQKAIAKLAASSNQHARFEGSSIKLPGHRSPKQRIFTLLLVDIAIGSSVGRAAARVVVGRSIAIGVIVGSVCLILAREFGLPVSEDLPELE